MNKRKQILKQMFDVKPTKSEGVLDMEKILKVKHTVAIPAMPRKTTKNIVDINKIGSFLPKKHSKNSSLLFANSQFRSPELHNSVPRIQQIPIDNSSGNKTAQHPSGSTPSINFSQKIEVPRDASFYELLSHAETDYNTLATPFPSDFSHLQRDPKAKRGRKRFRFPKIRIEDSRHFHLTNFKLFPALSFSLVLLLFLLVLPAAKFLSTALTKKNTIFNSASVASAAINSAKGNLTEGNFESAGQDFIKSYDALLDANEEIGKIGGNFSFVLRYIPGISKIASANYLVESGKSISLAGKKMTGSLALLSRIGNPLKNEEGLSLTDIFINLEEDIRSANGDLKEANSNLQKVDSDDLPDDIRDQVLNLKLRLPEVIESLDKFSDNSEIILDILGYHGPRKYLFIFQNNQEMRATGGFIGSYGVLDIADGRIRKLFVDDIYNPDGQLTARVVPPEPIQKMSGVWTMHDANWFPDYPTSAEKISWFYEKTGGPTVDGIVALTPDVMQKLLAITGPIEMPDYETTVNEHNFVEKTQFEVEIDYDKDENHPKKFIADLMPVLLDKVLNTKDPSSMLATLNVLSKSLQEKHMLLYAKNFNIENKIVKQGWAGDILNTSNDYLSVINSNINGYKTDGVIEETIEHTSDIQNDGTVIDEVTITRKHNGGNEQYGWWNKVNGDYIRVYVPENSKLLEATGQTREFVSPPLDYANLGFKIDPQLQQIEDSTVIDESSSTRVYTENRKTVFANWTYVSPGETVVLKYRYALPIKLSFDDLHHPADSFSVLYQKQSGSRGSNLIGKIKYPSNLNPIWKYPNDLEFSDDSIAIRKTLLEDEFIGAAFQKK